ncbi:MAG: CarD family transcriptional regulator [Evtepia sp.]
MKRLTEFLHRLPVYRHILDATRHQISPIAVTGLASVHRSYLAARLRRDTERPIVILCADEGESRRLLQDLDALLDEKAALLTAREFVFHAGTASKQDQQGRLSLFHALRMGEVPLLVVTVEALLQRTLPPAQFDLLCRTLKPGDHENLTSLLDALCRMGYTRCEQVEGVGQFAVRGGILDVFSSAHPKPIRMEFFGDEIDSMSLFDPATQRRVDSLLSATLLPAGEVLPPEEGELPDPPDLCLPTRYAMATATDYLPENALILVSESARAADRAKSWLWQLEEDIKFLLESNILDGHHAEFALSYERLCTQLSKFSLIWLDSFPTTAYPITPQSIFSVDAKQLTGFGKSLDALVEDLKLYHSFAVVILVPTERRGENLQMMLHDRQINALLDPGLHALPEPGQIVISLGGLSSGFEYPNAHVAVLTEGAPPSKHTPRIPKSNRQKLESYSDLSVGALVVHEHHGVGRFVGMVKMTIDGIVKDYIKLQFAGEDVLYVPAMQLDVISKYIGGGEDPDSKRLSKLGGIEWGRAKTRAKKAAKDLAKGLIRLYAQRQRQSGFSFSPDSPWQREFEDRFEYEETDDQLRCIEEIKRDMERPIPMDRLLCGDVGYGKTEVAFRAVMKCILDGKQAAILVPTTVLAQQHYMTALHRFEGTAVSIEMLSRFRTPTQARNILKQTEEGQVDLLIGTHKLLQKSVKFHDLGLLVVDEEQRFGVSHKERLKEMSKQVDVLVLSATPIPRTLNMALSGLRDMSSLEEPPTSRQPVQTYVLEHDFTVLCDAMRRELERGGQVYYLHNRVETIDRCAAQIASVLAHDVRVAVAHGKMDQDELGDVMSRMTDGEIDILVCTTIIETGIDLPNVNTLIVEDADRLGLAQLHQ